MPFSNRIRTMEYGGKTLRFGRKTLVMGILNVTPDSFSDGGRFTSLEAAVEQAKRMEAEGADILDIGGESTRPGFAPVTLEEELRRVIPVIEAVRAASDLPISIDTYKAEVARQALKAGASIVNDVWGLQADSEMGRVAAEAGCPAILMHNRKERDYRSFPVDVIQDLRDTVERARRAGIAEDRIILDPGIGFAKDYRQNLIMMRHLQEVADLGYPVMLGTSRKSMIRQALGLPADDVVEGTIATVVLGIHQGCDIVRVHDVKPVRRAADMTDAIVRGNFDE